MSNNPQQPLIVSLLQEDARRAIPPSLDLWPRLRAQLSARQQKQNGAPWLLAVPATILLLAVGAFALFSVHSSPATTGPSHSSIYRMQADGSGKQLIIGDDNNDYGEPAISSDGKQLAYTIGDGDSAYIELANADGGARYRLPKPVGTTSEMVGAKQPSWLHDQPDIAISAQWPAGHAIFAAGVKETSSLELVSGNFDGDNVEPAWSPNGSQIAFASNRSGNYEIYLWNAGMDVYKENRLTNSPGADLSPAWSPDGKQLVFVSERDGNKEIYIMDADGSNQRRLTKNLSQEWSPVFAPNGKSIAFASDRDGNWEIYRMNTDGSGQTNITNSPNTDDGYRRLCFSPDGQQIFYSVIAKTQNKPTATALMPTATAPIPSVTALVPTATAQIPTATTIPPTNTPPQLPATATMVAPTFYNATDLQFVDSLHGWVVGTICPDTSQCSYVLRRTDDGGYSWRPAGQLPVNTYAVRFSSPNDGWAFGAGLYSTRDGGDTWAATQFQQKVLELKLTSGIYWLIAGDCPSSAVNDCDRTLFRSMDKGSTWQPAPIQPAWGDRLLNKIFPIGPSTLYNFVQTESQGAVVPLVRLQKTDDGGQSWQDVSTPLCFMDYGSFLAGLSADDLWMLCVGEPGAGSEEKWLYHSTDGGNNWSQVSNTGGGSQALPMMGYAGDFTVSAPQHIWLQLNRWTLYGSNDGGITWKEQIPITDDVYGGPVLFSDPQHGWAVTQGDLFRTTDGGQSWRLLNWPRP